MPTYEQILATTSGLAASASVDERHVEWLTSTGVVGLSRTYESRIEIFLAGSKLKPNFRVVRESLEYQTWHRGVGEPTVDANRLLLPAAGHFDQVAAFLCTELLRNGADFDLASAFRTAEPVIELAISRLRLSDEALLGLIGELLLLNALLQRAPVERVPAVASSWLGWRVSTRDFSWKWVGVEVKTTTRTESSHKVQGVHQVEPQGDPDRGDGTESKLFLVSIGLEWAPPNQGNTYALPGIVDSIIARLKDALGEAASSEAIEAILLHIREYGAAQEIGYDHRTMATNAVFTRPFIPRFVRCYDMTDPSIAVLRSGDVSQRFHVDFGSVNFRVILPNQVHGDLNPIVGLNPAAEEILDAATHA